MKSKSGSCANYTRPPTSNITKYVNGSCWAKLPWLELCIWSVINFIKVHWFSHGAVSSLRLGIPLVFMSHWISSPSMSSGFKVLDLKFPLCWMSFPQIFLTSLRTLLTSDHLNPWPTILFRIQPPLHFPSTCFLLLNSTYPHLKLPQMFIFSLYLFFFFPLLLRNSWHTSLYKNKVYNMMVWFTYIVKWLPQ